MKFAPKNIASFFFVVITSLAAAADWIPQAIIIDNLPMGDLSVDIQNSKAVALKTDQLLELLDGSLQADKVSRIRALTSPDGSLTLDNLARVGISASYNEKQLRLTLIIPLEIRAVKDFPVLLLKSKAGLALDHRNFSGYLNLRGTVGYADQSTPTFYTYQQNPASGQLELVQNFKWFTFESTANYLEYDQTPIQRNNTSLVHDIEDKQVRVRLGDFGMGTHGFQSSLPAAGLQIQKQFNIYPQRGSLTKRSTTVQVKNNSLMEVYVNGNLISRLRVNVGPYNLKELPLLFGNNRVRIVLKDDFGGVEDFEVDLLYDDQILAEGVHDFTYQAGRPSFFVGNEKKYVNDGMSSFYHKYGLSNQVTLVANQQSYMTSNLFGLGVGYLSKVGTNFFDIAYYKDETVSGGTGARWRYNSPDLAIGSFDRFRIYTSAEFRTAQFNTISLLAPAITNFRERYELNFQKQLNEQSSFSLGATRTIGENFGTNDTDRRFTYQNRFAPNWRFDLSYGWTESDPNYDRVLLSLNWFEPEGKAQAAFAHDTVNNNSSVRVTKNRKQNYSDFQMDMTASKQKERFTDIESQNMGLNANYYENKFESRFQLAGNSSSGDQNNSMQLGLGTALAWTTQGVAISRPIADSFAIVEAQGLSKDQVIKIPTGYESDSLAIKNNQSFMYPDLSSYVDKPLILDSTSLGVSSRLEREAYILTPKYRSGIFVGLKVTKSLMVRGRLAGDTKDKAGYLFGKILTSDVKVFSNNFFTDEYGNFVVDGLSYGQYQIVLADPRLKKINFVLEESEETKDEDDSDVNEFELGTLKIEKETGT